MRRLRPVLALAGAAKQMLQQAAEVCPCAHYVVLHDLFVDIA